MKFLLFSENDPLLNRSTRNLFHTYCVLITPHTNLTAKSCRGMLIFLLLSKVIAILVKGMVVFKVRKVEPHV